MSNVSTHDPRRRQRGTAAIEFSLVMLLFFFILYGIVAYGALFIVKQGLNAGAGEAARVALAETLRGLPIATSECEGSVKKALYDNLWWLDTSSDVNVSAVSCQVEVRTSCPWPPAPHRDDLQCVSIDVAYDYRNHPLIPMLPVGALLGDADGSWMPDSLSATATVQIESLLPSAARPHLLAWALSPDHPLLEPASP